MVRIHRKPPVEGLWEGAVPYTASCRVPLLKTRVHKTQSLPERRGQLRCGTITPGSGREPSNCHNALPPFLVLPESCFAFRADGVKDHAWPAGSKKRLYF